jgi:nuclear RNA export factor
MRIQVKQVRSPNRNKEGATQINTVGALASFDSLYNREAKYLNLSQTEGMQLEGLRVSFTNPGAFRTLLQLLQAKCPEVESINFGQNRIRNLSAFTVLAPALANLLNVCFENNQVADFNQLDHLKSPKWRELIFIGNPIASKENYKSEITRRFPTLSFLDRAKLEPEFKFPAIPTAAMPPERGSFYDSPDRQAIALGFLKKYLEVFDANRQALLEVYTEESFFSLSVFSPTPPQGQQHQQHRGGGQHGHKIDGRLTSYMPHSRNLLHLREAGTRGQRIHRGKILIISELMKLPQTKHQLDDVILEVFLADGFPYQVLFINVHGHFWDAVAEQNRSYDRTFLLTPSTPAMRAYTEGWPAVIVNDSLTIRPYAGGLPKPTNPAPALVPPGIASSLVNTSDQAKIASVCVPTGLKPEFAVELLRQSSGDVHTALARFYELKKTGQVPANALA